MGTHTRISKTNKVTVSKKRNLNIPPPWPNNIGKRRKISTIWGTKRYIIIEDEILVIQSNAPHKLITFQKLRLEEEKRIEFRLGYYMIGVKTGAKGRWVWGQYALMIPEKDFKVILEEARKRKWF